jgi:hypothetical protein
MTTPDPKVDVEGMLCRDACEFARWEEDPRNEPPTAGDPGVDYGMTWMCRGRSVSHAYDVSKATVGSCPGFRRAALSRSPS